MKRREEIIWWALGLGVIIGLILIQDQSDVIGRDWLTIYRPATLSDDFLHYATVANPLYVLFIFRPLALLPPLAGYFILMSLSIITFRLIAYLSSVNKWLIFPSFPALWMLVYGQIDAYVALGVGLGAWAIRFKKPYWQGVAILLLCLKPHVGGILALVYLVWQRDWRAFVIGVIVGLLSLAFFGLWWPIEWVNRLLFESSVAAQGAGFSNQDNSFNNIGLFPFGLLFWPLVLIPYSRTQKIPAIISASILSSPYGGSYSLVSTMAMPLPILIYPVLSLPLLGPFGYTLIIAAPIALILWPLVKKFGLIHRASKTALKIWGVFANRSVKREM